MTGGATPGKPRSTWAVPWLLGAAVFLLVVSTASHYGVAWDEPAYFYATDLKIRWFAQLGENLLAGRAGGSFDDEGIRAAWRWDAYHVPHPPFSRIVSGLTHAIFSPFVDKFTAYRVAPALFFVLLTTVAYLWIGALFGRAAGLFTALTLVATPNLFGFAHFAVTDMPLAAMWFFTTYCFWKGLKDWRWSLLLGVAWGLALSTKFPALGLPIPVLLWAHLYHRPFYANNLFSMIFLSPLVMIATQPYLWHQTTRRVFEFLYDGLSRGYRFDTNFAVYFLDRLYFTAELPSYYPFFLTAVTTPETILVLALAGLAAIGRLRAERNIIVLFLFNAFFLLAMGLFPGAVLHDGMRQLLPVLPFLAALAGCGFFFVVGYLTAWGQRLVALQGVNNLQTKLAGALFFLLLLPPFFDLFTYHPYELSYYNRLVGGVRGAYQRGLEVTYFMEVLNPAFLRYLNEKLPPNASINAALSNFMLTYYQQEGRLRPDIRITEAADFHYFILVNRRSTFGEDAHKIVRTVRPHDVFRLDGAPLIYIYKMTK